MRPDPRIRLIEEIDRIKVFLVHGRVVRDKWWINFTEGGNDRAYGPKGEQFHHFPENEIWIDNKNADEEQFILLHEVTEWCYMEEYHFSYDHAHELANVHEQKARNNPERLFVMLDKARKRCLKLQEEAMAQDAEPDKPDTVDRDARFTTDMSLIEIISPGDGVANEKQVAPQGVSTTVHVYQGDVPDTDD